ncbi:MAG: flagellar motor switch protein FliN [Spirochaetaceae bacterium]|nr:flagellar motor switch protein FliN [Spirochaetaceae bacterium]
MMGDGALSQDEINALLSGNNLGEVSEENGITDSQLNKIKELFKTAATSLGNVMSSMAGPDVAVKLLGAGISSKEELLGALEDKVFDITVNYSGDVNGGHYFLINESDALAFGSLLVGQPIDSVDGEVESAFSELFSQFTGGMVTIISMQTGKNFSPVAANAQLADKGLSRIPGAFIELKYEVTFDDKQFILYEIFDEYVAGSFENNQNEGSSVKMSDSNQFSGGAGKGQTPNVQGVQFPNLTAGGGSSENHNISLLMNVQMELTVELGRAKWQIKDILGLGEGTIIELDKLAGEPVDILVNHNLIARGEVVVIDENFGVRVTEIISGMDKFAGNN